MLRLCILDAKTLGGGVDLSVFEKLGELTVYSVTDKDEIKDRIMNQDVVITNKIVLNESNLEHAKDLKLICLTATGTNNIDLEYAKSKKIAVTNVAGYSTQSVAQHTFGMLFYLLEQLKYYDEYVKLGEYSKSDIFFNIDMPFWELNGKVWGIIGLGSIGKAVAKIASAFGCRIVYFSTTGENLSEDYERMELENLLKISDVVSIHAPLNVRTKNLIDYSRLTLMQKHSILLNLGRGSIVNENDLSQALNQDIIFGAGLDVLEHEPIRKDNPLLNINNKRKLLITPHIAWASTEARTRLIHEVVLNIEAFFRGKVRNRV